MLRTARFDQFQGSRGLLFTWWQSSSPPVFYRIWGAILILSLARNIIVISSKSLVVVVFPALRSRVIFDHSLDMRNSPQWLYTSMKQRVWGIFVTQRKLPWPVTCLSSQRPVCSFHGITSDQNNHRPFDNDPSLALVFSESNVGYHNVCNEEGEDRRTQSEMHAPTVITVFKNEAKLPGSTICFTWRVSLRVVWLATTGLYV